MAGETLVAEPVLLRRLRAPFAVATGFAAVATALAQLGPGGMVPVACPFLSLTGLDCPLCGGTRSADELLHGHLLTALSLNALTTVLLLGLLSGWVAWLVSRARGRTIDWVPGSRVWLVLGLVVVSFWVLRVLPGPTSVLAA
jgi:hypothetical protein